MYDYKKEIDSNGKVKSARLQQQKKAKWFIKIHRRLIKPPYPVLIHCPACGRPYIRINADMFEIDNSVGLKEVELSAGDMWTEQKHSCGAKITLYWKA